MSAFLLNIVRNGIFASCFMFVGFLFNDLLHLYRFQKVGWSQVTGLWGQHQSIRLSFLLCLWVLLPLVLSKFFVSAMRSWLPAIILFPLILLVTSQAPGRSVLKFIFDVLLIGTFLGWLLIDATYSKFLVSPPSEKAFPFVISELTMIFQTSLAMLTFVIATFGFSFAPTYIEKYYTQNIGQPTVWWFAVLTMYLTIGVLAFICLYPWLIAVSLRSKL